MPRLTDSERAEVAAFLLTGASISEAARKYSLSKSTVSLIRDALKEITGNANRTGGGIQAEREPNEAERLSIDILVVQSLQNHLKMQEAITKVASDTEYLKRQNSADLSRLLEVSQNHTIRLLEAASDAGIESEEN